jgi:1-deoxy-D-xylulose-5-phosphate reductoisomerase
MALAEVLPATPRSVTVLGATGSVGCSTLELIASDPLRYRVEALTAWRDVAGLAQAARRHRARCAVIGDPALYGELRDALAGSGTEPAAGPAALVEAACRPAGWVMAAIVGAAGLAPTLAAVARGATVALANKECLVSAGALFVQAVRRSGTVLLPVDSEHNAIFQALRGEDPAAIEQLILTASGGPFRTLDRKAMAAVGLEEALAHPNWRMGPKITIDSATMMNKGLELIEAHHLFAVPEERIAILVHPQSIVHSLVAFHDGSVLAQLGPPDMRIPIAYALGWPDRLRTPMSRLDLAAIGSLTFEPADPARFPALRLAREALRQGGAAPTYLNAANEVAVAAFVDRKIPFLAIADIVEATLESLDDRAIDSLDQVLALDREARRKAADLVVRRASQAAPRL